MIRVVPAQRLFGPRTVGLVLVVVLASACGSGAGDGGQVTRDTPPPTRVSGPTTSLGVRAAPRWETVNTFSGRGPAQTPEFAIFTDIQWRVRWTCEGTGTFVLTTTPEPRKPGPIATATCPAQGDAYAIHKGSIRLGIQTTGAWTAVVDQQVDSELNEAPLPAMNASSLLTRGNFYNVEKAGEGTALLYKLADGRRFLRIENFKTAENTDLFVWLSQAAKPANSKEAVDADKVVLGNLKSTLGSQNYEIPASVPTDVIRSVVIWCQPVQVAYTAASLTRAAG